MTFDPAAQPGAFANEKPIGAGELLQLRAEVWANGSVTAAEAEKLFDMNRSVAPSKEWTEFFVEALCEFILSQSEPRGYVTEDEASWLLRHVNRDGSVETHAELELIVKLLEHAEYAPASLRRFALGSIEQTVLTGEGATRSGEPAPGRIDDAEVALIRRLVFAPASDGPAKVSATEAKILFRLKNATVGNDNSPEWKKLFVQGVANHLMGHQSYMPPSPEEELRLERPYESHQFGHALSRMGKGLPAAHELHDALFREHQDGAIAKLDHEVAADEVITAREGDWRKRLYDQDGQHDEFEQALLDFLAEERARPF